VSWVERASEPAFMLVPQAPARDTRDAADEAGWRSEDTQKLLLGLVDKVIAENSSIDVSRLYLTGLSMSALGSWKIIIHPDPAISRKFACSCPVRGWPAQQVRGVAARRDDGTDGVPHRTGAEEDYRHVVIPLRLGHADTDPQVTRAGSRIPFALLSGKGETDATGALHVTQGVLKSSTPLVRYYQAPNRFHKSDVRDTEYQFGNGDRFREIGMVTRNGHFSWEGFYKDQAIIDWMFAQRKR
jgi:predicted peptidase